MANILSVEINNRHIKLLEGFKKGTSLTVNKSLLLDAPSNSIDDGNITDLDSVVGIIGRALTENNIETKKAIFIINTNSIITRNLELPKLKNKKNTISMIKNELAQLLSADLEQYRIIYKTAETYKEEGMEKAKYIVYGIPLSMYNSYLELAARLNLEIQTLDLSLNCLDKIAEKHVRINGKEIDKNAVSAFIDIGYDTISFSVLNNGKNDFSRLSSLGIRDIIRRYFTAFDLSEDEALIELDRLSFEKSFRNESDISKISIAEECINSWIDEFNRYIRYYNSNNKDKQIEKIFIYGTYGKVKGLDGFMASLLNLNVEIIEGISNLTVKIDDNAFDIKEYFNTVLSLYIGERDLNFLSDKKKEHMSKFNYRLVLIAVSFAVVLTAGYYLYSYILEQNRLIRELETMNQYLNDEEHIKISNETEMLKRKSVLMKKYTEEINTLKEAVNKEDAVNSVIFEEIGRATPIGTFINSFGIDSASIKLQCSSASRAEIAQFEKNLKDIEFVDNVYIPAITGGSGAAYSYSIVCGIKDGMR